MKVREVRVRHFRNVADEPRTVSFVDPGTGLVRPLTVLVGSNGSGKSTLFETIEALLSHALEFVEDRPTAHAIRDQGYADVLLEFDDVSAPAEVRKGVRIVLGRKDWALGGTNFKWGDDAIGYLEQRGGSGKPLVRHGPRKALNAWVAKMIQGDVPPSGGLLTFPHNRWIEHEQRGSIEPPAQSFQWLYKFEAHQRWQGSLAQLWVWQNYLDLERGKEGTSHLAPFVETIEKLLGAGRKIAIREGHVQIVSTDGTRVEPHQLPSGEQQILTLFGEIMRRLRRGGVLLIDEIEISLHPSLQRAVLGMLRTLAAQHDLQIVVTTHSMQIVESVAAHEVVNLDDMVLQERVARRAGP